MNKIIKIGDNEYEFRSTAATPIKYRNYFHADMFADLMKLGENIDKGVAGMDMGIMLQLTYAMLVKPDKPFEEWLDRFELFDIVDAFGELMDLWGMSAETVDTGYSPKNPIAVEGN